MRFVGLPNQLDDLALAIREHQLHILGREEEQAVVNHETVSFLHFKQVLCWGPWRRPILWAQTPGAQ
jgi:hypothetical protein